MNDPHFFGYGSLVNTATHSYPRAQKAVLKGWKRSWVRMKAHEVALLTAVPAEESVEIEGLIAAVPNADWLALDEREAGYQRIYSKTHVRHNDALEYDISHYAVSHENMLQDGKQMILMSYLDVVIQGYLQQFGEKGVEAFITSTEGWTEIPVLNDRSAPRYPRHQMLSMGETALVDQHLINVGAQVVS